MRRQFLVLTLVAFVSVFAPVSAHDDYRIIGAISAVTLTGMEVKEQSGRAVSIALDSATRVTRDGKKASVLDLKTGLHVVVDATGDSLAELVAVEVRIVPSPPAKR